MRFTIGPVVSLTNDCVAVDNYTSYHGIGCGRSQSLPGQFKASPHVIFIHFTNFTLAQSRNTLAPVTYTIKTIREIIKKELAALYPDREIDSIINILCLHRLDLKRHELGMRKHEILMPPDTEWFKNAISKLKDNIPVQYITGNTEFYGLHLKVSPAALIPRQETEELVRWTGTGCIALALAKGLPGAFIYATDLNNEILDLARENARLMGLKVDFILHDISSGEPPVGLTRLDIIVSNPPYIPIQEKGSMDANVSDHEPDSALFVPNDDPLVYYRHIATTGRQILRGGGVLYLEIHENFGQQILELLKSSGFEKTELRKDINGKDRMVMALRP